MKLTETQTEWIISRRNEHGLLHYTYGEAQLTGQLQRAGIIEEHENQHGHGWRFTPTGQQIADDINRRFTQHDIHGMTLAERIEFLAEYADELDDKELDRLTRDRSSRIRETTARKLIDSNRLTAEQANRLAHDRDRQIRQLMIAFADPIEYAEEDDSTILYDLSRSGRDLNALFEDMYDNDRYERRCLSIDFASEKDIPTLLADDNAFVRRLTVIKLGERMTSEQVDTMLDDSDPAVRSAVVFACNGFTDIQLDRLCADPELKENMLIRLDRYRSEYRKFHKQETLFADPEGEVAKRQRRLALTD